MKTAELFDQTLQALPGRICTPDFERFVPTHTGTFIIHEFCWFSGGSIGFAHFQTGKITLGVPGTWKDGQ